MQALRLAIPAPARTRRDAEIVARLLALPEVAEARTIALFCAIESKAEIDLRLLGERISECGRLTLYPRLSGEVSATGESPSLSGELAVAPLGALVPSAAGFLEPPLGSKGALRGEVDVVIVPALAVSATGHRLGYGSGFYDRTLPAYCPPALSVIVAYDFQLVGELPLFDWDVACDVVITDARTLRISR
jgi:5-formyltetrahydrofolate cyclo-ligase